LTVTSKRTSNAIVAIARGCMLGVLCWIVFGLLIYVLLA
jgi:hypothetical protein